MLGISDTYRRCSSAKSIECSVANSTIGRAANCTVDSVTIVGHNVFTLYCAFKSFFYLENNKNLCITMSGIYVKLIF